MTVTAEGGRFEGVGAAIAGTTDRARATAGGLARCLGMRAIAIADRDRAAYHAAASIASNFLVTLEAAAERLAGTAGVDRDLLAPLVRATVENWVDHGAQRALTGPIARGDLATVERQRGAVAARAPDLVALFDALDRRDPRPGPRPRHRHGACRSCGRRPTCAPRSPPRVEPAPASPWSRRWAPFTTGHLSLMRRARAQADVVVVSLFVNPTQFRPGEDLAGYPRDELRDAALADAEGVDLLFAPTVAEVFPDGSATQVRVAGPLTERLEGAVRGPEHFNGVTTVVAKLLHVVAPDAAYFGQKDAQQALVIRSMVRDLDLPVRIVTCPTVREPDGLALSSRNAYLEPADRERAPALRRGLDAAEAAVAAGQRDPVRVAEAGRAAMAEFGIEPEYFEIVNPEDLSPVVAIDGNALVAVAARVGPARLIDNTIVRSPARVAAETHEHEERESPCSV